MTQQEIDNLTINELCGCLKNKYKDFKSKHEILTLHKLIEKLSIYDNTSFGKLRIKEIESRRDYKYFLLDCRHPNINAFLLYKDIINKTTVCL